MRTKVHGNNMLEIIDDTLIIQGADDVLDLFAIHNCSCILLHRKNITEQFFDLSTGIAGEILQKFSTYHKRLAIIGDFSDIASGAFTGFVRESNTTKQILFVHSIEEASTIFNG